MRERLTRIFIIAIAALVVISLAKGVADWRSKARVEGESVSFPPAPVKEKLENLGENILGEVVEILPGAPDLGVNQVDQDNQVNQENQETEPIEEPVKNVQQQTQTLIEAIKKLPEDQVKAVKKQIYKEFCEGLIEE